MIDSNFVSYFFNFESFRRLCKSLRLIKSYLTDLKGREVELRVYTGQWFSNLFAGTQNPFIILPNGFGDVACSYNNEVTKHRL